MPAPAQPVDPAALALITGSLALDERLQWQAMSGGTFASNLRRSYPILLILLVMAGAVSAFFWFGPAAGQPWEMALVKWIWPLAALVGISSTFRRTSAMRGLVAITNQRLLIAHKGLLMSFGPGEIGSVMVLPDKKADGSGVIFVRTQEPEPFDSGSYTPDSARRARPSKPKILGPFADVLLAQRHLQGLMA